MPETPLPQVGDTVRIVIEGPVYYAYDDGDLQIGTAARTAYVPSAPEFVKSVEIVAPPLAAGDPAPLAVLDELPHGSVVIAAAGLVAQLAVSHTGARIWQIPGRDHFVKPTNIAHWPATVLHIGAGR